MPYSLLAGYSGVVLISLAYTPDRVWALWAMLKLFEAILVLGVLNVLVRTTEQLKRVIDVMLAGSALVLAFYWLDILRGTALESGAGRFVTTWLHPNGASMIAFTFTSIVAGRFFTATSQRKALIAGLLTCLGALTGLMIAGKTALIGGVLALILTIAITLARQAGYATLKKVLLVGLGLMFVTFYIVVKDVGIAAHLEAYSSEDTNVDPTSLTGRVAIWSVAIQRGLSSPIIGNGYMSTITTGLDGGEGWITGQAHNSFIQPFVDNGLIGFFLVLAIYIAAWHAITRQILTLRHMNQRWGLSVELLAGLTVLTVNSFTEVVFGGLFEIHTMLFIMIVFAIYQNARVSDT
jgi:O-antigen ligase